MLPIINKSREIDITFERIFRNPLDTKIGDSISTISTTKNNSI